MSTIPFDAVLAARSSGRPSTVVHAGWRPVLPTGAARARALAIFAVSIVAHASAALVLPGLAREVHAPVPTRLTVMLVAPVPALPAAASMREAPAAAVPRPPPAPGTSRATAPTHAATVRRAIAPHRPAAAERVHGDAVPAAVAQPLVTAPPQAAVPAPTTTPTPTADVPLAPTSVVPGPAPSAVDAGSGTSVIAATAGWASNDPPASGARRSPVHTGVAYLANPPPDYPAVARRLRLEGTVLLRVLVGAGGMPEEVRLATTSGATVLDDAAIEAVRRWRFVAAQRGDETIAHWTEVPVRFRLAEQRR